MAPPLRLQEITGIYGMERFGEYPDKTVGSACNMRNHKTVQAAIFMPQEE
jgi:hypothetical protein